MFRWLQEHPDVAKTTTKEIHYFDRTNMTEHEYMEHFQGEGLTIEATPDYFCSMNSIKKISEKRQDAKIIILLRDPIERAWSHYIKSVCGLNSIHNHYKKFSEAFLIEMGNLATNEWSLKKEGYIQHGFFGKGLYYLYVVEWIKRFPYKNLFIIRFEDMIKHPDKIYKATLKFLGLKAHSLKSYQPYTGYGETQKLVHDYMMEGVPAHLKTKDLDTIKMIGGFYQQFNKRLYEMIGVDLLW